MRDQAMVMIGIGLLSAGTFGWRFSGRTLRSRIRFPARAQNLLEAAAVVLLTALVAVTALTTEHAFTGPARPSGVLVAGILAWRKVPFVLVVMAAAATTAVLRLLGLS